MKMKHTNQQIVPRLLSFGAAILFFFSCSLPASGFLVQYIEAGDEQEYSLDVFFLNPSTVTYDFTVGGSDLILTHLGLHDRGAAGLDCSYDVCMWNAAGELIADEVVPGGTAGIKAENAWYAALFTPVRLTAGETYVIGSWYAGAGDNRVTTWNPSGTSHFSAIGVNHSIYESDSLEFPNEFNGSRPLLGPTFGYSVVPEPSSYVLMLCGLAVLILVRCRARASA